ncbi:hypothetical protein [Rubrivirga sp. IMCC45206]|uniref:hypothetical protein n=1 Tax=Rubrivirga sp. IMCC45206 TaxID=3391614 RepID=UPI00398FF0BC
MRSLLLTAAVAFALSGCDSTGLNLPCEDCGSHGGGTYDHPGGGGSHGGGSDGTGGGTTGGSADADVFIEVDPRQTYLRTFGDHALDAPALRLADEGLKAGDHVCAVAVGDFILGPGIRASEQGQPLLTAIFSADDTLSPSDERVRIKTAVEAGDDVVTPDTESGGHATDVPQDFDATSVCVTIPAGARYVFLSTFDTYYADNTADPDGTQPFGLLLKR